MDDMEISYIFHVDVYISYIGQVVFRSLFVCLSQPAPPPPCLVRHLLVSLSSPSVCEAVIRGVPSTHALL